jgi:putative sigma-54 modulation protein
VTLHVRGDHFMHGAGLGKDAATAVAGAFDKIDRQGLKLKSKWTRGKRKSVSASKSAAAAAARPTDDGAEQQVRIVRARRYEVKPMSVDEAALEVGADRSAFIVFRNASTDTINVLFRRPDGNLGLIEPEA